MPDRRRAVVVPIILALLSACTSAAPASPTPTPAPSAALATPSPTPTVASAAPIPTGEASVSGPAEVPAGTEFDIDWTGPNAPRDYVTIVAAGATKWTDETYFYTTVGSPGRLVAPLETGDYELWYVSGADSAVKARSPLTVTGFVGSLTAPAKVMAGSQFDVSWTGPDGPGDYVTIVVAAAERWTNESYFNTSVGPSGTLVAPITTGAHEIWYVPGQSTAPQARRPITVEDFVVTLDAPDRVKAGAQFEVAWTGPDGPSDYITIVPVGSAVGTFTSYAYTNSGSPVTITAPETSGDYEIWYASDRVSLTFARRLIEVE